jgi:hypothetical protein
VQVVERAFGLFKWKWGIFWRPLDIDEKNIRKVIEATARLHNMCIDCKTSSCLTDFICHDDLFWQRTGKVQRKKPLRYLLPDFQERQLLPDYADAAVTECAYKRSFVSRQHALHRPAHRTVSFPASNQSVGLRAQ